MSAHLYSLPCPHCQQIIPVAAKQAGQTLDCEQCQQSLQAPDFREIKQLELYQADQSTAPKTASGLKKTLFAVGLGLAVLFSAAGFSVGNYASKLKTEYSLEEQIAQMQNQADQLDAETLYRWAASYDEDSSLNEYREVPVLKYNRQSYILTNVSYGLYAIAGIGALMLLVGLVIK